MRRWWRGDGLGWTYLVCAGLGFLFACVVVIEGFGVLMGTDCVTLHDRAGQSACVSPKVIGPVLLVTGAFAFFCSGWLYAFHQAWRRVAKPDVSTPSPIDHEAAERISASPAADPNTDATRDNPDHE